MDVHVHEAKRHINSPYLRGGLCKNIEAITSCDTTVRSLRNQIGGGYICVLLVNSLSLHQLVKVMHVKDVQIFVNTPYPN